MNNEEIVVYLKNGKSNEYMQLLYDNNLPAIKAICRKYAPFSEMDDLLQESYFGLIEAVEHYDTFSEVKFWTYASWWITQAVIRYIEKNGASVHLPINVHASVLKYKRCVSNYEMRNGEVPSVEQIADIMKIPVSRVYELQILSLPVLSMDESIEDTENCLGDTLAGSEDVENEVIDKLYIEYINTELWEVINDTVNDTEKYVINELFVNRKSLQKIADELGISASKVRAIKERILLKLKRQIAKRDINKQKSNNKLETYESRMFSTGLKPFKRTFTSSVESIAMQL